jgi:hypothetical protein
MSTSDHPQTDGQSESRLKSVTAMLRHYCDEQGKDWDRYLWAVEFAYNDAVNSTTGLSPFQADLGRDPATPSSLLARLADMITDPTGTTSKESQTADEMAQAIAEKVAAARRAILRAQHDAALSDSVRIAGAEFRVGDYVFLRDSARGGLSDKGKMGPCYFPEPLRISQKVGRNAYKLMMPKEWRMHSTVNVSFLKPAGSHRPQVIPGDSPRGRVMGLVAADEDKDGHRRLRVKYSQQGRVGRVTMLPVTVVKQHGDYKGLAAFAKRMTRALPAFLGRFISRDFTEPGTTVLRPYEGMVIAFDATSPEQTYEILYEDGEVEWISYTSLRQLLLAGPDPPELQHLQQLADASRGVRDTTLSSLGVKRS